MTHAQLFDRIKARQSFLCVGLDPDPAKMPAHLDGDIWAFNRAIIDATRPYCVAYKPNFAFYEALGRPGWEALERTIEYIGAEHLIIADAKRGDIGNTSQRYAQAIFQQLGADAITVAPYMGHDSVRPFLGFPGKWVILLALTSNPGSGDFQFTPQEDGQPLFAKVMRTAAGWAGPDELMFVCGATHPERFRELRTAAPDHFFLVPGIGAQGGDLQGVCRYGMNRHCGLLVNSSRGIIYASTGQDFAAAAATAARALQQEMAGALATFLPE